MDAADRPDREAIVLRFPPGGSDEVKAIMKEAKYTDRHWHQGCRLSVWVSRPDGSESVEDTLIRLVRAAALNDLKVGDARNRRLWWTTAGALYDAGLNLAKDGYPGEATEHYSVVLGDEVLRVVVERFVQCFGRSAETERFLT